VIAQPVAFVDRDGVINVRNPWIYVDPRRLSFVDGSIDALIQLADAGYRVVIVTNQPWVGYGVVTPQRLEAFHGRIRREVENRGGTIDAIYACTHKHSENCACRKPGTGMLDQAADRFDVDVENSWMFGDKSSDVQAGKAFGANTAWITGQRFFFERDEPDDPDLVAETLADAVRTITRKGA
jgi:D-glycero-D-manno-heptose 1,7-bisphosphate phosphatase